MRPSSGDTTWTMTADPVPDDIRDFIQKHIDSIAQLEALLLLRGSPEVGWDTAKAAARLYTSEQEASAVLERLSADGFLTVENGVYRYQCNGQQHFVDRLAGLYARHLISVTNLIHAKPRRIREFADAFKLKKETKD
jgi:hypothetical protein